MATVAYLWDYLHSPERNELQEWAKGEKLGVKERAQLNSKLDLLERIGFESACVHKYVTGTSGDHNHIFKLIVKSQRMLRPMLCRGPLNTYGEVTLLCGAIEKDYKLHPPNAASRAEEHRGLILDGVKIGHERRVCHERF
jgi:hypothetical protein